jgi:hypothetical protein
VKKKWRKSKSVTVIFPVWWLEARTGDIQTATAVGVELPASHVIMNTGERL